MLVNSQASERWPKLSIENYGELKNAGFRVCNIDRFESADDFHFDGIRRVFLAIWTGYEINEK